MSKALFIVFFFLVSCADPFSYSIYDAYVPKQYRGLTQMNLDDLESISGSYGRSFKVALLSDVHYHYDELVKAIKYINSDNSIFFTIVIGDLTDQGLLTEFMLLHDALRQLDKPYFTVIGNHDYLANGELIYSQMFGDFNYNFVFDGVKFILFDDIFWESNKTPDFEWFKNEVEMSANFRLIVPISHIPPGDGQFTDEYTRQYHEVLDAENAQYSFHGHVHGFSDTLVGDTHYVTVSSVQSGSFTELTIGQSEMSIRQIHY
jgi:predicted phosphodiesterase